MALESKRFTKNVNPLIGRSTPDTLAACSDLVSFLQSYVRDNEDLKNCPTAMEGFHVALENLHHALSYEYEWASDRMQEPREGLHHV